MRRNVRGNLRGSVRRNLGWLAGLALALACSVNSSNLDLDAGTCPRCVGTGGASASGGQVGSGGASATGSASATGGQVGSGGDGQSGGTIGTGGSGQSGGAVGTGGSGQSGGTTGTGGDGQTGGNNGKGGNNGNGGNSGKGGNNGSGGQGGAETCDMLATDYANALTTARKCTVGAPNQCQQLVDDTIGCSNCREYVEDASMLNALEAKWTNQGCATGHVCSNILCVTPATSCVAPNPGAGPGGAGMCESSLAGGTGP